MAFECPSPQIYGIRCERGSGEVDGSAYSGTFVAAFTSARIKLTLLTPAKPPFYSFSVRDSG
jgi:hypothetical protein